MFLDLSGICNGKLADAWNCSSLTHSLCQGHKFIDSIWLTLDECSRNIVVVESVPNTFIGGSMLPLRRDHEAATRYASSKCGWAWCMNDGEIPSVSTVVETSHTRRFRCTYHRPEFT